ncbi:hypothetical protein OG244_19490 [Streptomyces brevispora]|uniref:hypothetical protein n=1 Tax=Streptomyces brevispora TaxID=887462 RepID=UPI002E329B7B|nr:hypothetical protein [Streptomyces brevispora]
MAQAAASSRVVVVQAARDELALRQRPVVSVLAGRLAADHAHTIAGEDDVTEAALMLSAVALRSG